MVYLLLSAFFFLEGERREVVPTWCNYAANSQSIYSHMFSEVATLLSFITYRRGEIKQEMERGQQEKSFYMDGYKFTILWNYPSST